MVANYESPPPTQQSRGLVSYFCVNDAILTNGSPSILYITWTNNSTWYISSCKRISVMKMYIDCRCIMHNIIARLNSTLDVLLLCRAKKGQRIGSGDRIKERAKGRGRGMEKRSSCMCCSCHACSSALQRGSPNICSQGVICVQGQDQIVCPLPNPKHIFLYAKY